MKVAIYAGSFDPPTNGHLWMIREGAQLFDELIVAIGINPDKRYTYSVELRLEMLRASVTDIRNVKVTSFASSFVADYARQCAARYILRGIRSETDYEYERGMRYINEDINADLSTIFLVPPRALLEVSSSMVKGLRGSIGWEKVVRKYVPPTVYVAMLRDELGRRFEQTWTALGGSAGASVFEEIATRYSQPHRHYHTLAHLCACLSELDALGVATEQRQQIELAIWFHDVIYDVPGSGNERRSADYFQQIARKSGIAASIPEVVSMILATERHTVPPGQDSEALRLFLDIDISILGATRERFAEYDADIRREYSSIPEDVYRAARHGVLEQLRNRPKLFLTRSFRDRYEQQARDNLQWVLETLAVPMQG